MERERAVLARLWLDAMRHCIIRPSLVHHKMLIGSYVTARVLGGHKPPTTSAINLVVRAAKQLDEIGQQKAVSMQLNWRSVVIC